jgi:hypothetical protein
MLAEEMKIRCALLSASGEKPILAKAVETETVVPTFN